jgi:hypothetical protein
MNVTSLGCYVRPSFNYKGVTPAVRCAAHKLEDMVDVTDLLHGTKCEEPGCYVRPGFNYKGVKPAVRCAAHKLEDIVDVRSAQCEEPGCYAQPSFNYKGVKPAVRCAAHKLKDMVDVRSAQCEEPAKLVNRAANVSMRDMSIIANTFCAGSRRSHGCYGAPVFYQAQMLAENIGMCRIVLLNMIVSLNF